MKKLLKRIQLIHRTNDGKYKKFWQNIDCNKMFTLEHVWNDINQQFILGSSNNKYKFYCYKTNKLLPTWYHVNLLNDNDQILIDESAQTNKPTVISTPIKAECFKNISKKKQLKVSITNRSFIITNKYSIPNTFYEQWEEVMFFRDKVAKVSLRDMLEIQERLGTKNFTKALQNDEEVEKDKDDDNEQTINETKKSTTLNKKILNQPISKSEPIEMSSKRRPSKRDQVPVHMRGKKRIVDPRFNEQFGDYDAKEFRQSYHFITDMRRKELNELKKQLKGCQDPNEKMKLKTVINRLKSQVKNVDDLDRVEKISKDIQEKSEQLANDGESTPYITKEVRKVMKLATTYTDLKNTGRIDAYLSKKRKRLASKKKKQMPTRRVNNDEDEDD
ncbi:unnamed protein product [Rotaria sordida]|uniref:rRNA biogenesis protein RRP36 n=1 Tax=Rotaria sordida TaxID=392033 RepID=A0A819B596_9BILA|nr:unnamed protein product [Rotaria sordida]